MSSSTEKAFSSHDTAGYVGFANLPNQVHRKSVKKGFEFTLMVVGESGLGKSTLINSLFLTDLYPGTYFFSGRDTSTVSGFFLIIHFSLLTYYNLQIVRFRVLLKMLQRKPFN